MRTICFILVVACFRLASAQNVGINSTGAAPDNSAMLDVASTNKGLLIPRMTAALRLAISSPANSLLVFDTDSSALFMYNLPLTKWERINPTYNFNNIIMGNSIGDVLVWNGTAWIATPKCNLFTYIYKDADGDGHGDRCEPLFACAPFPCYVADSLDRNDQDPTIYPGAPELCDNKDNDQDGQIDEFPVGAGGACAVGIGACQRTGSIICVAGSLICSAVAGAPSTEICNGIDDNCDGIVDGITQSCYTGAAGTSGVGACRPGTQTCTAGSWSACVGQVIPVAELCDGIDNNCNGTTDETWPLKGTPCSVGVGACQRNGVWICNGLGTGLVCSVTPGAPSAEICNGIDDNCDGIVDGITRSCYTGAAGTSGVGACRPGTQTCTAGSWGTCVGEVIPVAEVCDGIDNNCNGTTDETWPLKGTACSVGVGACQRNGVWVCNGLGTGLVCSAIAGTPTTETCNGIDDNCNGTVDEGLTRSCYTGPSGTAGVGRCRAGTQNCSAGLWGTCLGEVLPITEIIGNGIDDDCNGIVQ